MAGPPRLASRLFNPLVLALAGTRFLPLYGVLIHRGRRSGTLYRTPVVVRRAGPSFIVPMPWGEQTDWYRNVRAAGSCTLQWRGRTYRLEQPQVVAAADAAVAFSPLVRRLMGRLAIRQCLRLVEHGAVPVAA